MSGGEEDGGAGGEGAGEAGEKGEPGGDTRGGSKGDGGGAEEEEQAEMERRAEEAKRRGKRMAEEEEYWRIVLVENTNRDDLVIVTTKAQINVVMSDKALVKHLQRELARLESELRSPAPTSSNGNYSTLLRKKDLQIQRMENEIRELTKQWDLAESRIQDLLQMIGHHQNSMKERAGDL